MDLMDFKLMDEANYNFTAQNTGWIYEWTYKFENKNPNIMTPELRNEIITQLPSLNVFENPVPSAQINKAYLEEITKSERNLKGMSK